MKKLKFSLFLGFVVGVTMMVFGCGLGVKHVVITPEATMPQDMSVVISFDHSSPEQVALFKQIIDRVPSLGFWEEIVSQMDSAPSPFKYSENKDLVESNWKIVFGAKLPSDPVKLEKLITGTSADFGSSGVEVYVAGKFADPSKVQTLLDEIVRLDPGFMEFMSEEKNPTWRAKKGTGNAMIVRMNDVYFITVSAAQKDEILKRIDNGTGFDKSENYQKSLKLLGEQNLGYLYLDMKLMNSVYKDLSKIAPGAISIDALEVMKGIWAGLSVRNDGVQLIYNVSFDGDKALIDKYYPNYKLSLVDKVPSKGVILYEEMPSLGFYLEGLFKGMSAGFKANLLNAGMGVDGEVTPVELPPQPLPQSEKAVSREKGYKSLPITDNPQVVAVVEEPAAENLYESILEQAGAISDLTVDDIKKIFDSPYAFVVSDVGGYVPAVALYLQVNKESVENAKKLVSESSTYMDAVIVGLNAELKKSNLDGIVKKEVKIVEGATLQKIYVDWTVLPVAEIKELSAQFGVDILTIKIEFYYGVLNDGIFVFVIYPDFIDDYGKEVISSADYYKAMRANAGDVYGRAVVFFRTSPILELIDRYFQLAKKTGLVSDENDQEMILGYELYTKIASAFNYIFVSDIKDANGVRGNVSLGIKEVQLSPELLKKREAIEIEKKAAEEAMVKMYQEAIQ